jgi:glycerol-3-phosphate acyltransferase PlsX
MVTIAVDAMGGDYAPRAIIEGVGQALDQLTGFDKLLLVGDREQLESELTLLGKLSDPRIEIVHASQVVHMNEPSGVALRAKRDSSITVAAELVKQGRADAVVSAGHTGAAVASTVVKLRTLPGIERPGIATVFPTPTGPCVLLDAGANINAKPMHLLHYAVVGEVYAREILGIASPRVGLLSVGEEECKGNDLTKEAFKLLSGAKGLNFIGNVEGHGLFSGVVDVVVCDGFVGNVVLKSCESLAKAFSRLLKERLMASLWRKLGALFCRNAFRELREFGDASEYGGAPLLGVNGVCIIGHGSSSPVAVRNAIRVAVEAVRHQINKHIVERIEALDSDTQG